MNGKGRYFAGTALLLLVVVLWVTSNELTQYVVSDNGYNKPFLVTYLAASSFCLYLIKPLILLCFGAVFHHKPTSQNNTSGVVAVEDPELRADVETNDVKPIDLNENVLKTSQDDLTSEKLQGVLSFETNGEYNEQTEATSIATICQTADANCSLPRLSNSEIAKCSAMFMSLYFLANYLNNAALHFTSVSSATLFTATSGLFSLLFGVIFKIERFTVMKLLTVIGCFAGVVLITLSDHSQGGANALIGNAMSITSALIFGFYLVILKKKVVHEDRLDLPLYLGFLGLFTLLCFWPLLILLHFVGWEVASVPTTNTFLIMLLNAFVGSFLSDYFWLLSMLMTSPVMATFGLGLTIPLAILADYIMKDIVISPTYFVGTAMIVVSFVLLNIANLSSAFDNSIENCIKHCISKFSKAKYSPAPTQSTINESAEDVTKISNGKWFPEEQYEILDEY